MKKCLSMVLSLSLCLVCRLLGQSFRKGLENFHFTEVLEPAIRYAEEGFPLSPILGKNWELAYKRFKEILKPKNINPWFETFAPEWPRYLKLEKCGDQKGMRKHCGPSRKRMRRASTRVS